MGEKLSKISDILWAVVINFKLFIPPIKYHTIYLYLQKKEPSMFSIINRYKSLPNWMLIMHIFGKSLAGFGIGLLLGVYVTDVDWMTWGWVAIVASLLIQLPVLMKVVAQKAAEKALKEEREIQ